MSTLILTQSTTETWSKHEPSAFNTAYSHYPWRPFGMLNSYEAVTSPKLSAQIGHAQMANYPPGAFLWWPRCWSRHVQLRMNAISRFSESIRGKNALNEKFCPPNRLAHPMGGFLFQWEEKPELFVDAEVNLKCRVLYFVEIIELSMSMTFTWILC